MRARITAIHEGVDTNIIRPNSTATFKVPGSSRIFTRRDEVITYVARNLEPYRGFHVFMRALPQLLRRRRRLQVVIVGGDEVSYGAPPPPMSSYRAMMLSELGSQIDLDRVHFTGLIDYRSYLRLLQVSSVHVYLTYPFVLSWSFVEALACGCVVVGSSTPPVLEVLRDSQNGLVVDFFSHRDLAERIEAALAQPQKLQQLRAAARATAVEQFDLKDVMLPKWTKLFEDLVAGRRPPLSQDFSSPGINLKPERFSTPLRLVAPRRQPR